jgi:hypothetical protein
VRHGRTRAAPLVVGAAYIVGPMRFLLDIPDELQPLLDAMLRALLARWPPSGSSARVPRDARLGESPHRLGDVVGTPRDEDALLVGRDRVRAGR